MGEVRIILPQPHPGQLRVIENARRYNVLMCGRRFGKTTLGVNLLVEHALAGHSVAWFAPTYKLLADPWREIRRILKPVTCGVNVQERRLDLITGGSLDFWTLENDDPARGRKYKRVLIDEAGLVRNFDSVWFGAIRPTLSDFVGDAFLVGTPKGQGPFYHFYLRGKNGSNPTWQSFNGSMLDNPHIPATEAAELASEYKDHPELYDQEINGIPIKGSTNPFGQAAIERCTKPLSDLPPVVFGVDLAQSVDWTVIIGLDRNGDVCVYERFQHRPWPETMGRVVQLVGDVPAYVDSTGVGAPVVAELQRRCGNVTGFVFTAPSKKDLMGTLALAITGGEVGFPDGEIVQELESFEAVYSASGVSYSAPKGLHDDCVCALALAVKAQGNVVDGEVFASFV